MSTFKERYDNDPEFRKKHLKYIQQKKTCECGAVINRNNSLHKKTEKHKKLMKLQKNNNETSKIKDLENELQQLQKRLSKIETTKPKKSMKKKINKQK